jgi:serine/threonine-protein kinase
MGIASLFEDLLDQYKIEHHIVEKRYTNRFEAYDVDDDRLVWLDVLRSEYAENSAFAGRFVSRAQVLGQVRNPNIAQVLHVGKAESGAPYVAQEAIDGYSLAHRLEQLARKNTPVHPVYALSLVRQVANALLLAERLELFHHELQPDHIYLKNFALPTEDSVLLLDLFIPPEKPPRALTDGEVGVNAAYLAPEQGAGREITAASHVYSLGAILFRLLAGRMTKGPRAMKDRLAGRVLARATELETERGDLSAATYQLVERCLQKDPRHRFDNIEAFLASLEGALEAEENRPRVVAPYSWAKNRRAVWLLPLLLLVLLLAAAAAFQGLGGRAGGPNAASAAMQTVEAVGLAGLAATASPTPSPTATATDESTAVVIAPTLTAAPPAEDGGTATRATRQTPTLTPSPSATAGASGATLQPAPLVRVVHNMVNMRSGPGIEYPLFGVVTGGEMLEVLAWNGREEYPWLLIITPDRRIGWIAATVVQINGDLALADIEVAATIPPTPPPTGAISSTPSVTPIVGTVTSTVVPDDGPGGGPISTAPPDDTPGPPEPTAPPPIEPTRTPPP